MWEYQRINREFRLISDIEDKLNELGRDGWEVTYYFEERPKKFGDPHKSFILLKKPIRQLPSG